MRDINVAYANVITGWRLTDALSYTSRTAKRLLRIVFTLAEDLSESDSVAEHALVAEAWFACVAPVHSGY
jgi:hypothetical protein